MAGRFINNQIFRLLILLFSCTSCKGQVKNALPDDTLKKTETIPDNGLGLPKSANEMKSYIDNGIDPYFVETNDTFSIKGPQFIVRNLILDKKGNIWLATWHGIIKYDGKIFTNYTLKYNLIHFHVLNLFEDSNGNVWFGTARGGVYRYDGISFKLFTVKDGLPDNTINCIAEDQNGNIWLGTQNGLSRYNLSRKVAVGEEKSFTNFSNGDGLSDNYINAILKDSKGNIWVGTNKGIDIYNGKSFNKFTYHDTVAFNQTASLFEDGNGNVWIGSGARQAGGNGLCQIDVSSKIHYITPFYVMYMHQDKMGNLWYAHNRGAEHVTFSLYKYNAHLAEGKGNPVTEITEQHSRDNPVIFGITEDKKGNIWFGTAKGVCCYDGKSFNYFTD